MRHVRFAALALVICMSGVSTARGNLSDEVLSWIAAHDPAYEAFSVLSLDVEELELTGRAIIGVKTYDFESHYPRSFVFDESGTYLDDRGLGLRISETERRFDIFGAMDDELYYLAIETPSTVSIPIAIWLRTYETGPSKEELLRDRDLTEATESLHEQRRDEAFAHLIENWDEYNAGPARYSGQQPVAYAEMTPEGIFSLTDHPAVAAIYWDKPSLPLASSYVATIHANTSNWDGLGRGVCVIEPNSLPTPNGLTISGSYCGATPAHAHGQGIMGIIRSSGAPYGTATDSTNYFANWDGCDSNGAPAIQYCATVGADIWNFSHTCNANDNRLFDFHTKVTPYPFISVPSGNQGDDPVGHCPASCSNGRMAVTCKIFNGLVVGGSDDCADSSRGNDKIWCYASDSNVDSRELPNLVAPAKNIDSEGYSWSGTSIATPQVAGAAAQISELEASLDSWPEATRAILMAGANEDVDNGRFSLMDAVDDRDGAGELDIYRSIVIAGSKVAPGSAPVQHGFYYGTIYSASTAAGTYFSSTYRASHVSSFARLRVVIAWDSTATCTNPALTSFSCATNTLDADLDLYVFRDSDGALMGSSTSNPNSYEFVEFATTAGQTYTAKIAVDGWTNTYTYYGIAWSQGLYGL